MGKSIYTIKTTLARTYSTIGKDIYLDAWDNVDSIETCLEVEAQIREIAGFLPNRLHEVVNDFVDYNFGRSSFGAFAKTVIIMINEA